MHLPRVVATPHLMGRPLGVPGDADEQNRILHAALHLLQTATQPNSVTTVSSIENQ